MKNINLMVISLIAGILFSCSSGGNENLKTEAPLLLEKTSLSVESPSVTEEKNFAVTSENNEMQGDINTDNQDNIEIKTVDKKKIIKDGDLSVKVDDIQNAKQSIDTVLKSFNAYYESENFDNSQSEFTYNLKIRIPSVNFEKLLQWIEKGNGEITAKNIRARDITEEYLDIETRLNSKKLYLKKYNELLNRASSVKDIIALQENIRNLQEEIESKEGRLKYLNDQVAYSTLNLLLFKEKEYIYKPQKQDSFFERLKTSLNNGWSRLVDFTLVLIQNWALLVVITVFVFFTRRYLKKRKAMKS